VAFQLSSNISKASWCFLPSTSYESKVGDGGFWGKGEGGVVWV